MFRSDIIKHRPSWFFSALGDKSELFKIVRPQQPLPFITTSFTQFYWRSCSSFSLFMLSAPAQPLLLVLPLTSHLLVLAVEIIVCDAGISEWLVCVCAMRWYHTPPRMMRCGWDTGWAATQCLGQKVFLLSSHFLFGLGKQPRLFEKNSEETEEAASK